MTGFVYLVGAGPGDPQLLTLRGLECLRRADVVLYDYLVNPVLATWGDPQAVRICLGKHGKSRIWSQAEIEQALVEYAQAGKVVVRLKGGDPAIFARGAEEVATLERHGIPYEIVPGITAALAAGSHAGIPLTHREVSSAVALVTGHEEEGRSTSHLDFAALARFPGTLVVYMGVKTAATWVAGLIDHGMPPERDVALIRRCSFHDQQTIRCRLDEVPGLLTPYQRFPPPVIAIIGPSVAFAAERTWFTSLPLRGECVLVTRPHAQARSVGARLRELGAGVLFQPAIEIEPVRDMTMLDQSLRTIREFDWVVFSSQNGVTHFLNRFWDLGLDVRALGHLQLAAIGPSTAATLAAWRLRADVAPSEYRAEALAEALIQTDVANKKMLLIRASRGREVLRERLEAAGAHVQQVVAYTSRDVERLDAEIQQAFEQRQITWIMVSSSAIAQSLDRIAGHDMRSVKLASISPVTSATLRTLGYEVAAEARSYTLDGMIDAIVASCGGSKPAPPAQATP